MSEKMTEVSEMDKRISEAKELLEKQGSDGNWDYSEYMLGMYNGMELILATIEGHKPSPRRAPAAYVKPVGNGMLPMKETLDEIWGHIERALAPFIESPLRKEPYRDGFEQGVDAGVTYASEVVKSEFRLYETCHLRH